MGARSLESRASLAAQVSQMVSRELEKECIVVFDEAHNIDNVCIEARAAARCRPPEGGDGLEGCRPIMGPSLSRVYG